MVVFKIIALDLLVIRHCRVNCNEKLMHLQDQFSDMTRKSVYMTADHRLNQLFLYLSTNNLVFRPDLIQTGLYSHRRWLQAGNVGCQ